MLTRGGRIAAPGRPLTVSEGFLLQEVRDVQVILAAAGEIGLNNGRKVDVES